MSYRIVFFGSPDFAVESLEAIFKGGFDVPLVVTQPDRQSGRGKRLTPTPVRVFSEKSGISVECISSFKGTDIVEKLNKLEPDFLVVVAFGLFLPDSVLKIAKNGNINLHASLLPAYRGASPINHAIVNGEQFTGVTTIEMVHEMDAGPIYLQRIVPIEPFESAGDLSKKLAGVGAELLVETLVGISEGKLKATPQGEEGVSFAYKLKKSDGEIPWGKDAISVHNHIRGMNPWPGSYSYLEGKYVKVHEAEPFSMTMVSSRPGTIVEVNDEGIFIACGRGVIRLKKVQFEGRKALYVSDLLKGYNVRAGEVFGSLKGNRNG